MGRLLWSIALIFLILGEVQAQWIVAAQDQDKRDLNGIGFVDNRFGWVIGDSGLLLATIDEGDEWIEIGQRRDTTNLKDLFFLQSRRWLAGCQWRAALPDRRWW